MFTRVKTTPNSPRKSVQLVESVRDGVKVKQKIVRHIGIAMDDDELRRLKELAEVVKAKMQSQHQASLFTPEETAKQIIEARSKNQDQPLHVNLKRLREEQRVVQGIHEVYGEMYHQLGFDSLLPAHRYRASSNALFHTVMARIANPDSKRGSVRLLEEDFGVSLSLEKIYRMMDQLDDVRIDTLRRKVCQSTQTVLGRPVTVLFFDCTTLYFESFSEDDLKQNGYSKDCKFNQPQVLLALMVTQEGLPVGYEVFPGATFEGHTLIPLLEKMKQTYSLERVVCVADRGMLNEDNLKALEAAGAYYVVGAKLKQLPKATQQTILAKENYQALEEGAARVLEVNHNSRRLVVSWSPKRADKDAHDRQKAIEKLQRKLTKSNNPKDLLNNYGYKKFLSITGHTQLSINQGKVEQAQCWDGLHGVITNLPDDERAKAILGYYQGLWQVEESFRITKHDLKVRPIYHWTPSRVRAHLAISFMAFSCVRHLMYRTKIQQGAMSAEVIRNALVHVQTSILKDQKNGQRYAVPSNTSPEARKLYQVMGLPLSSTPFALN